MLSVYAVDEGKPCRIDISARTRNFVAGVASTSEGLVRDGLGVKIPFKPVLKVLGEGVSPKSVEAYVRKNPTAGTIVFNGFRDEVSYTHPETYIDYGYFKPGTTEWISYMERYPTVFDYKSRQASDVSWDFAQFFLKPEEGENNRAWDLIRPYDRKTVARFLYMCADIALHQEEFIGNTEYLGALRNRSISAVRNSNMFSRVVNLVEEQIRLKQGINDEGELRPRTSKER